jgi:hypothetical protein
MKMESVRYSETPVNLYPATRLDIPDITLNYDKIASFHVFKLIIHYYPDIEC